MSEEFNLGGDLAAQLMKAQKRSDLVRALSSMTSSRSNDAGPLAGAIASLLNQYFGSIACAVLLRFPYKHTEIAAAEEHTQDVNSIAERFYEHFRGALLEGDTIKVMPDDLAARLQNDAETSFESTFADAVKQVALAPVARGSTHFGALCVLSDGSAPFLEDPADQQLVEQVLESLAGRLGQISDYNTLASVTLDPFTGLYKHSFVFTKLMNQVKMAKANGRPVSCLYIDIDDFLSFSDGRRYEAMFLVTQVIKTFLEGGHFYAARCRVNEFVVVLPDTATEDAKDYAEKIRLVAHNARMPDGKPVSISVGVATVPDDARDTTALMELAEHAMRYARDNGKNRVCTISGDVRPKRSDPVQNDSTAPGEVWHAEVDSRLVADVGIFGAVGMLQQKIDEIDGYGHDRPARAAELAFLVASALKLKKEHCTNIQFTAMLHGFGKIVIDKSILRKPSSLNDEESLLIQTVPGETQRILSGARYVLAAAEMAGSVREKWDGSGYPKALKGEEIPLGSRIVGIVDAYVAMTSDRPYREAMTPLAALAILQEEAGTKWDARLVQFFVAMLQRTGKLDS